MHIETIELYIRGIRRQFQHLLGLHLFSSSIFHKRAYLGSVVLKAISVNGR